MKSLTTTLLIAFCCLAATLVHAQTTAALSVQGILKKSDGSAVPDGLYKLRFGLYDDPDGGTEVWYEELNDVETTGGVYSTILGINGKLLDAPFDKPYFLGVKINGSSQELKPRPRLTPAPYAMALLGKDNKVPSTGAIEAYGLNCNGQLNAKAESTFDGTVKVNTGIIASTGDMNNGNVLHGYAFIGDGDTGYGSSGDGNLNLWANGAHVMNATNAEITMNKYVHITGSKVQSHNGQLTFLWNGAGSTPGLTAFQSYSANLSLKADDYIQTKGVYAISDRRIKKDFTPSNAAHDLSQLMRLRVTDYKYKDFIGNGDTWKKGFIAQEVAEIEPEVVHNDTGVIPDIYAPAQRTRLEAGTLHLVMEQAHGLKVGDKVRIMGDDHQEDLLVQATPSATTFTVGNWSHSAPEKVFVYGREVNDFHSVDYDQLFTMNVSATQELARRVESLEKENAAFKSENTELRQLLEGLRADVNALKTQR